MRVSTVRSDFYDLVSTMRLLFLGSGLAFSTPGWGVYGLWTGLNMSLWTMVVCQAWQ